MGVDLHTEVRKLRPAEICKLGQILNPSDNWKKLMASVTKEDNENEPKFPAEYITILEQAARQEGKFAAVIFLEEWGTIGKKRPTLGLLLNLLMKAQLFRAADYLAVDILQIEAPERPGYGPAAPIDIASIAELLDRQNLNENPSNDSNFCLRTTSEIPLEQINYPMYVFDSDTSIHENNLNVDDNDVGIIEMRYAESKSKQVLDNPNVLKNQNSSINYENDINIEKSPSTKSDDSYKNFEISDLMKFSASNEISRSDLIKFDSSKKQSIDNIELHEAIFPDLNILCPATTRNNRRSSIDEKNQQSSEFDSKNEKIDDDIMKKGLASSELPVCLRSFAAANKSSIVDVNSSSYNRELISAELPLCINNRSEFNTSESNFNDSGSLNSDDYYYYRENSSSAQSVNRENSASSDKSTKDEILKKVDAELDLPCFVVEANARSRNDDNKESVECNGINVMNSRELPITVLEFHRR